MNQGMERTIDVLRQRAKSIVINDKPKVQDGRVIFEIKGSTGKSYSVSSYFDSSYHMVQCTCPDFQHRSQLPTRKGLCKHILASLAYCISHHSDESEAFVFHLRSKFADSLEIKTYLLDVFSFNSESIVETEPATDVAGSNYVIQIRESQKDCPICLEHLDSPLVGSTGCAIALHKSCFELWRPSSSLPCRTQCFWCRGEHTFDQPSPPSPNPQLPLSLDSASSSSSGTWRGLDLVQETQKAAPRKDT